LNATTLNLKSFVHSRIRGNEPVAYIV